VHTLDREVVAKRIGDRLPSVIAVERELAAEGGIHPVFTLSE
jgi:hypothetical protein